LPSASLRISSLGGGSATQPLKNEVTAKNAKSAKRFNEESNGRIWGLIFSSL
jgi:hypothetical protein